MKKFVIVGSGRQGIAAAYDLLRNKNHHVTIVDINKTFLKKVLDKLFNIIDYQNLNGITADEQMKKKCLIFFLMQM